MIKLPDDFLFQDIRGTLRATHFLGQRTEGLEGVPFKPVQMLIVHNNPGVFRGFHYQTRQPMRKAVFCMEGLIRDFALNPETGNVQQEILTPATNGVIVEAHEAHGYYSPGKSTVIYFYDKPYLPEKQAGFNPVPFCRQLGFPAVISEQDAAWPEYKMPKSSS